MRKCLSLSLDWENLIDSATQARCLVGMIDLVEEERISVRDCALDSKYMRKVLATQ